MAIFKYVGSKTKSNGKIDLRVGSLKFFDITPDVFEIEVEDGSKEEIYLEQAVDIFDGTYMYVKKED
jgi:hypothetical protein